MRMHRRMHVHMHIHASPDAYAAYGFGEGAEEPLEVRGGQGGTLPLSGRGTTRTLEDSLSRKQNLNL